VTRFVCDQCGKTADVELPTGWSSVQSTTVGPGEGPNTATFASYHLCEEHGLDVLLGA